ncbi:hypothetical protein ESA94_16355 [Lacibacter luteus]|uniref:Uncharacterized protein n=1 Tax=Lacibacter luteus TaxID=2508719 RepID=A0A4Q1CGQ2_9BACT|nr:hypothetical protein [Lacibacter luteus]RXK58955.1 hypothetical protein ESA94_16355 [Lacibacter luteus]
MEIEQLISILEASAEYYSQKNKEKVTITDIEDALYMRLSDKYNFEWRGDLWDIEISITDIIEILNDFDFSILTRSIETNKDLLPDEFLLRYKVKIKSNGLIWIIHRYDKDPFPSNPHAHQLENNIKLDLSTGKCYKVRSYIYTISKKNLIDIRLKAEQVLKIDLPPLLI